MGLVLSTLPVFTKPSKNGKGVIVLNFAVYCIQLAWSHLQHTRLRTVVSGLTYSKTKQLFMCMQTIKINLPTSILKINVFDNYKALTQIHHVSKYPQKF